MNPTNKLRFVVRKSPNQRDGESGWIKVRVLQQWWEPFVTMGWADVSTGAGEWRDVELVEDADET